MRGEVSDGEETTAVCSMRRRARRYGIVSSVVTGLNENTNGLLHQYFPKGTNLAVRSQEPLDEVANQLNGRPGKTLGFETPAERFEACAAMTV